MIDPERRSIGNGGGPPTIPPYMEYISSTSRNILRSLHYCIMDRPVERALLLTFPGAHAMWGVTADGPEAEKHAS
jgi:hypothetical protein